jgi:hypothetical protein
MNDPKVAATVIEPVTVLVVADKSVSSPQPENPAVEQGHTSLRRAKLRVPMRPNR